MNLRFFFHVLVAFAPFVFLQPARAEQVVFSEIMYQPPAAKPEFIEVWNITNTPLDTAGWRFSDGIEFTFPNFNAASAQAHFLKPMERIIVSAASVTDEAWMNPPR